MREVWKHNRPQLSGQYDTTEMVSLLPILKYEWKGNLSTLFGQETKLSAPSGLYSRIWDVNYAL